MSDPNLLVDGESQSIDAVQRYLAVQEQFSESAVAPELLSFVQRISAQLPPSHACGSEACHPFHFPAKIQPLDDNKNPLGKPFHAVTRDLSIMGLGVVYTRSVDAKFLLVTIRSASGVKTFTVEVTGCRSLGAFYDIGGRFVND